MQKNIYTLITVFYSFIIISIIIGLCILYQQSTISNQKEDYYNKKRIRICIFTYGKGYTDTIYENLINLKCYNPLTKQTKEFPKDSN